MAELFLTDEEMIRLTGRKARRLQAEQLRKMGVPFYLNAANIPIVARVTIEGHPGETKKPEPVWELDMSTVK